MEVLVYVVSSPSQIQHSRHAVSCVNQKLATIRVKLYRVYDTILKVNFYCFSSEK